MNHFMKPTLSAKFRLLHVVQLYSLSISMAFKDGVCDVWIRHRSVDPVSTILYYLVMSFIFFLSVTPADPSGLRGQWRIGQI